MSNVAEIEDAISKLSPDELAALRHWFRQFDADEWDRQFEKDVALGKLDALGNEALKDARNGGCREL